MKKEKKKNTEKQIKLFQKINKTKSDFDKQIDKLNEHKMKN